MARPRGSLGGAGGAPEVAMTSCSITLARPVNGTLVKTITVEGGKVTSKRPSPNYLEFVFVEQEVCGLEDLYEAVIAGASLGWIVVRGKPKNPRGRRAIYDSEKGPAGLDVVPRRWVGFDWDNLPLEPVDDRVPDPLRDPEIGVALAMMRLPPAFREVSCIWQISAGAGLAPGFRMRTWHWLDRPCLGVDLKEWVRPSIDRGLVDPCTLVEVQPHYLAVRVVGGPDPCPARFGIWRGAGDAVPVPDIARIRQIRERRERLERAARAPVHAGPWRGGAGYPRQRIGECLAAIRTATARHTTYRSEAARALAICQRYGIDWAPVRAALIRAYEATLTPAEANTRREFSTEGVLRWLEERA